MTDRGSHLCAARAPAGGSAAIILLARAIQIVVAHSLTQAQEA